MEDINNEQAEVQEEVSKEVTAAFDAAWEAESLLDEAETGEDEGQDQSDESDSADEGDKPEAENKEGEQSKDENPADENDNTEDSVETETDQSFELKHLGEVRKVGKDEAITLAQKGLDYDRIKSDRENLKAENKRLSGLESFIKEMADGSGQTVDDLIDSTRARILSAKNGTDEADELKALKAARANQPAPQAQEDSDKQEDFIRFSQDYPDVKAEEIPKEVWLKVKDGARLTDAYAGYEAKTLRGRMAESEKEIQRLKDELATANKNLSNKAKSTGTRASAGAPKITARSAFADGWDAAD